MYEDMLDFICLLDSNANSNAVYARFYKNFLFLIARNRQRIKKKFWRSSCFYFRDVMSFWGLGGKVRYRKGSSQRRANTLEVWS